MVHRAVLKLNASYEPLAIITVRNAIELLFRGKAVGVEEAPVIRVVRGMTISSVIRLRRYRHVPIRLKQAGRKNILLRDGHRCQYCGRVFESSQLTLDHIFPRSRGGRSTWDNLVAACIADNHRKADRTPEEAEMPLIRRPLPANIHTTKFLLQSLGAEVREWDRFLYRDSAGDARYLLN